MKKSKLLQYRKIKITSKMRTERTVKIKNNFRIVTKYSVFSEGGEHTSELEHVRLNSRMNGRRFD